MNNYAKFVFMAVLFVSATQITLAQDIVGIWQSIDDKTNAPKALIEIKKDSLDEYSATIIKVTPSAGYKPQEFCTKCTGSLKNKPILGMTIFSKVKEVKPNQFGNGHILDPLSGKYYKVTLKLGSNGNHLRVLGYLGIQAIGRTQTWVREK